MFCSPSSDRNALGYPLHIASHSTTDLPVFSAWKEKFQANILDMGGKLKPGGKIVTASGVTDGPCIESKEIVGGYMLVTAESYERAIEHECP